MSDRLVKLRVQIVVCIKQIELNTTNISNPYRSVNLIICIWNVYDYRITLSIENTLYRNRVEVLSLILGNLLTIHAQSLCEIAKTIKETDSAHVNIAVGSLFNIVTGKHSKTTRVNLQSRVDTILHTEICHRRASSVRLYIHIVLE